MSQENVDVMRQGLAAVNRRDRAAWLALCDPEVENIPPLDWPESDPIRGGESVHDFLVVEAQAAWEEEDTAPFEYVELMDAGNDKVVADLRRDMRGKASGASVAFSYWQVVTFRNEKMVRIEWFRDRSEALKAADLSE
jgi:ketosteroid isomerase-like protein